MLFVDVAVLLTLSSYSEKNAGIPEGWIKTGIDDQMKGDVLTLLGLAIVIWRNCLSCKQHLIQCSSEAKTGYCVLKVYSLVAAMHLFTIVEKVRRLEENLGQFTTKISEYLNALPTQGNPPSAGYRNDTRFIEFTQLRKHKDFVEWLEKPAHLRADKSKLHSMFDLSEVERTRGETEAYGFPGLIRLAEDIHTLENEFALLSTPEIIIACTSPSFVMVYNEGVHRFTSSLINSAINDDDLKKFSNIPIDLNHPQQSIIKSEAHDILRKVGKLGGYNHTQLFTDKEKHILQEIGKQNPAASNSNEDLAGNNKTAKALSRVVNNLQVVSDTTNKAFNAICMPKRSALELANTYNDLFSVQVCGFFFIFSISYKPSHISRK